MTLASARTRRLLCTLALVVGLIRAWQLVVAAPTGREVLYVAPYALNVGDCRTRGR